MPATAYRALLDERGKVYWLELRDDGQTVRYDSEPGASVWQRLSVWFISLLPVESCCNRSQDATQQAERASARAAAY